MAAAAFVNPERARAFLPGASGRVRIWKPISTVAPPGSRLNHSAVWTGDKMLIWGGQGGAGFLNTGSSYRLSTNTWSAINNTTSPRARHRAEWVNGKMVVWGGEGNSGLVAQGAIYDSVANTWTNMSTAPISSRVEHSMISDGTNVWIWGGFDSDTAGDAQLDDGAIYNIAGNSWTTITNSGAPGPRAGHTAVWTGTEMIIYGGYRMTNLVLNLASYENDGRRFDGTSWTTMANGPGARAFHSAVWTGSRMIVWGGCNSLLGTVVNDGAMYNPSTNTWTGMSMTGAPAARQNHKAVWCSGRMYVWGGDNGAPLASGGIFDPSSGPNGTWSSFHAANAPGAREGISLVSTDTNILVWGGRNGGTYYSVGHIY